MNNFKLSSLLDRFSEPETLRMAQLARDLQNQGKQVIGLSLGEPDFNTPEHIKQAAVKALKENWTHYPPVSGYADLREAICEKFEHENHLSYTPNQIIVSTGAKQSIANLLYALVDAGEEVIIPAPFWVTYSEIVRMVGGVPIMVETGLDQQFKIRPNQLEEHITSRTKLFMFSSPCNPTGSFYHKDELEALSRVFERHPQVFIMSDEIYEYINYVGDHCSIAQIPSMKDRTAVVNGFSKGFSMTGWRLGYMAVPDYICSACNKIQGQITSGANSFAQKAAVYALRSDKSSCKEMKRIFEKRKKLMLTLLKDIPGLDCVEPEGAFYVFPRVSSYFDKRYEGHMINSSSAMSMYLLQYGLVSSVSGYAFGLEGYIRFSYAASEVSIEKAMYQVKNALAQLS